MVPRALADTARELHSLREVRAIVSAAVQRGRCPLGLLAAELAAGPIRGSRLLRTSLSEVTAGIRSVTEADLQDLIKDAQLPMPVFNARVFDGGVFLAAVDAWWPEAGVAAEADSREWHLSAEDWQRTMRRHDRLVARGILVLHFSPQRIRNEPRTVASEIRAALSAGSARPALSVKVMPASA
jgi:very-short-patch-repair endonuclease